MKEPDNLSIIVKEAAKSINNQDEYSRNRFYLFPNHDIEWLSKTTQFSNQVKSINKSLFVGGVLYAGIYSANNKKVKVDAIDINPFSALGQLYVINCLQNDQALENLLLDQFANSNNFIGWACYDEERVNKAKDLFEQFVGIENKYLFMKIFSLTKKDDKYLRVIESDNGPGIVMQLINKKIKPLFPNHVEVVDFLNYNPKTNYDYISTNNVVEYVDKKAFLNKCLSILEEKGIIEITECKNIYQNKSDQINELDLKEKSPWGNNLTVTSLCPNENLRRLNKLPIDSSRVRIYQKI